MVGKGCRRGMVRYSDLLQLSCDESVVWESGRGGGRSMLGVWRGDQPQGRGGKDGMTPLGY